MKPVKLLLLGLGVYLLFITVRSVGLQSISSNLAALQWKLAVFLVVFPFVYTFDALGWAFAFPKDIFRRVPFGELLMIRIVGETFNCVIPWAASLGGEPVKAALLKKRRGVPLSEGFASILIVHTTFWLSLNVFVIGAIAITLRTMTLSPVLWKSLIAFLVGLGLVAVLLIIGLHLGIFQKMHAFGENFKWWGESSGEKRQRFLKLDEDIRKFYLAHPGRFFASSFFNFLGWFAGILETYLLARFIGLDITFAQAWLLEALMQVLRIVTFFIPSSIGAQEGGIVLLFSEFGYGNAMGLTFAVLKRIRELIWISFGLVAWLFLD